MNVNPKEDHNKKACHKCATHSIQYVLTSFVYFLLYTIEKNYLLYKIIDHCFYSCTYMTYFAINLRLEASIYKLLSWFIRTCCHDFPSADDIATFYIKNLSGRQYLR